MKRLRHPLMVEYKEMMGNLTGRWRVHRPIIDYEKCVGKVKYKKGKRLEICSVCKQFCPESSINFGPLGNKEKPLIDYLYCKGCGICAGACRLKAIKMVEEYELEGRKFRQPGKRSKDIPEIELSKSLEIRWHGRGGQGIWTASALFSQAVLLEGKSVRSSPEFGAEREGAPIKAYTRIGDEPIEDCSPVYNPDIIVIIDPTVVWEGIFEGLKRDGKVIVNYYKPQKFGRWKTFYVNATKIALEIFGKPYFNTPMLGATAKVTKAVELNSVIKVAKERFSGVYGDKNVTAIERGYEEVMEVE